MAAPITVFADFACPFSCVTEIALRQVVGSSAELRHRAYELVPEPLAASVERLPPEQWEALATLAESAGITLKQPDFRPRTRKAHEAAFFARAREREPELREGIFRAYWSGARDIGRIDVLMEIAAGIGLDPEELKIALDIDRHGEEVQHDTAVAHRLRLPGTPTIYLGSGATARVVVGAHGAEALRSIIEEYERTRT